MLLVELGLLQDLVHPPPAPPFSSPPLPSALPQPSAPSAFGSFFFIVLSKFVPLLVPLLLLLLYVVLLELLHQDPLLLLLLLPSKSAAIEV